MRAGSSFRQNFDIYHALPGPKFELANDLVWFKASSEVRGAAGGVFFRLSENPGETKANRGGDLVRVHSIHEIEEQINATYCGHHQYCWVRPRSTWLDATCPVYIDFGDDLLAKLEIYDESGLSCIRWVSKRKFVHDSMTEGEAKAIATRFYPLSEAST